jgi:2-oxoglutarate dehydrogenase E2 component (dihydrolipoamide succinyltransferase)
MAIELRAPEVGESITEVLVAQWLKSEGDFIRKDEPVVELESDKATIELPAPVSGRITQIVKAAGETAQVGELIAYMEPEEAPAAQEPAKAEPTGKKKESPAPAKAEKVPRAMPSAKRILAEKGLQPEQVEGTGPGGRILKEDALSAQPPAASVEGGWREEKRVPMTPMRQRIAQRLIESQQNTVSLTTFNEIDMSAVIALRKEYQEAFQKKYDIKLGFMSFFVKAAIDALKQFPQLNARVEGKEIVYHNYYDIAVAVSGGKGLVAPVLRNAERMSFAEVELAIHDFATRAGANKIGLDELQGGTFTISNGGVFGSMLSTPVLNPPQSGILGMHRIVERPVAVQGRVEIRPVMYVALTYDHRIVDGRESVTFLVRIKEAVENPVRMLIEV